MQDQLLVDRTQQLQPSQTLHGDHQLVAAITRVLPQLIYNRRGQRPQVNLCQQHVQNFPQHLLQHANLTRQLHARDASTRVRM